MVVYGGGGGATTAHDGRAGRGVGRHGGTKRRLRTLTTDDGHYKTHTLRRTGVSNAWSPPIRFLLFTHFGTIRLTATTTDVKFEIYIFSPITRSPMSNKQLVGLSIVISPLVLLLLGIGVISGWGTVASILLLLLGLALFFVVMYIGMSLLILGRFPWE